MKSKKLAISIMIIALVALLVAARLFAPSTIKSRAIALVKDSCKACQFEIQDLDLSLLPLQLIFNKGYLAHGDPQRTKIEAWADRVVATVSVGTLFHREVHFADIQV